MALASSENHERTFHKQKILGSAQVRERGREVGVVAGSLFVSLH